MKLFFFNDKLDDPDCHGSFCTTSRGLNQASKSLGLYSDPDKADYIFFIDAFNLSAKYNNNLLTPILVSEYNLAMEQTVKQLEQHKIAFAISEQAKNSFVSAGADPNKIHVVHLGSDPKKWTNLNKARANILPFTFLTANSSNERSGYDRLIPAFLQWSKDKNVRLIVKDQLNPPFQKLLHELDVDKKIQYISDNLNDIQLNYLYNSAQIGLYINNVTSFGLNVIDGALAGLPQIVSRASALTEFTSDEFVTYVDCETVPIDSMLLAEWAAFGLKNNLPPLTNYSGKLLTSRPIHESIISALDYAYNNYLELVTKNERYSKYIKENLLWENSVKNIVKILNENS